jgi:hypothetical protein
MKFTAGFSMGEKMNSTSATSRLKGLVWVAGAVAAVFAVIALAPVISHLG